MVPDPSCALGIDEPSDCGGPNLLEVIDSLDQDDIPEEESNAATYLSEWPSLVYGGCCNGHVPLEERAEGPCWSKK